MSSAYGDRASQFLPFAALTGYEALVRERTKQAEPRRELSEMDGARLAEELAQLSRGDRVRVERYHYDGYETVTGRVRQVDTTMRVLRLEHEGIPFDDLWHVQREEGGR